ncbi:GNAT family N-acetyltransferase [Enterococcus sp. HY326]|uniref:GNAT family N-acetyltransferase n=1 Tax=Enterococcus sp. HY326 TaxID=2971265 RepID=UPI002240AC04|nr:GNAT family N-acetyltransferase [Enterococcus sp. HY326]
MAIVIREVQVADYQMLAQIISEDLGYQITQEFLAERLETVSQLSDNHLFVAADENNVVGFIQFEEYQTVYFAPLLNILGLAVAKEAQGQGVGRQLVSFAEEWGQAAGFAGVRLNSGAERVEAHRFYQKIGYTLRKQQANFSKMF